MLGMRELTAALAACVPWAAPGESRAQLTGAEISISQLFEGPNSTGTQGAHVYGQGPGGATTFIDPAAPRFSWTATSPGPSAPPFFDNSIACDYTSFHSGLAGFAGTTSSMIINTITVPARPGSVRVFNSAGAQIGQGGVLLTMILVEVPIDDVRAGPTPTMTVVWDDLIASCYPDCNEDGVLSVADFGCFQTAYVVGASYADCNEDLELTVADFGCFQTAYVLGCP